MPQTKTCTDSVLCAKHVTLSILWHVTEYSPHFHKRGTIMICFTDEQMKAPKGKVTNPRSPSSSAVYGQDSGSDQRLTHLPVCSGCSWLRQNWVGVADSPRLVSQVCRPPSVAQQMTGGPAANLRGAPASCATSSTHHLSEPQLLQLQTEENNSHLHSP